MTRAILVFLSLALSVVNLRAQAFSILVLGISQDGGYPQANCRKACCESIRNFHTKGQYVTSLALIDSSTRNVWLIDCGPDFKEQVELLITYFDGDTFHLKGIFLSHAHIGHYLGLAQLGREVMGASDIPVYVMPRMRNFLEENGPWDQLIRLKNIRLEDLSDSTEITPCPGIAIRPIPVPHRDEYSETVGFRISSEHHSLLFIPDIDKWKIWDKDIKEEVRKSDFALIDATFYNSEELGGRSMDSIPHPFVVESMALLRDLDEKDREKVRFIHMNHTNPILRDSPERKNVLSNGFGIARQGEAFDL